MKQVLEVATYWGGELFSIEYVSSRKRLEFPEGVEVRTQWVDAAPRMPRSPMDFPYLAVAAIAACAHGLVISSFATNAPVVERHDVVTGDRFATTEGDDIGITHRSQDEVEPDPDPPADHRDDRLGPESVSLEEARTFGVIGLLHPYAGDRATTSWAPPPGDGGALWGDAIGDSFGVAGVSLSGVGQGGGGGNALGNYVMDRVRTDGLGGLGHGHLGGTHTSTWHCTLRYVTPTITGRLPPESIRRVVHDNLGRFRSCYEKGLARDAKLEGRVATKFVIGRDGTVAAAADAGSELADAEVIACMQRTFSSLEFPASPSGVVTVVYPIDLSPTP